MSDSTFENRVSQQIWDDRYRYRLDGVVQDRTLQDSWQRVAAALASVEPSDSACWHERFHAQLNAFRFLPGGRILAGAGTGFDVTLFNCFVMGRIEDSMEGIFEALKEGAITMQSGGGVGYDFSTLRPSGVPAWRVGGTASGPVSFMRIWDSMCETLLSTAARRGAMMATLRCDHPDIEAFIDAKQQTGQLHNFNLSVLVSDAFMRAMHADDDWPLVFPADGLAGGQHAGSAVVECEWPGYEGRVPCVVLRVVRARALWDRIMQASYESAEPGVLFVDRINRQNNLAYRERISATNPCGEIPLPPYGACNLGSINLTRFVSHAFTAEARIDLHGIAQTAEVAVRMLDNVIDLSRFPLPAQQEQAHGSRRVGLGITGLANALIMLGLHYGSDAARQLAATIMRTVCHAAYRASIKLAEEKGSFPFFERDALLQQPFITSLPQDIQQGIHSSGLRNSHLTAIAPTGTISLLANNVSSGIEPVFSFEHQRQIRDNEGSPQCFALYDYSLGLWRRQRGEQPLPDYFVAAHQLTPQEHLQMQAALQSYVDNAISKTVNIPEDFSVADYRSVYEDAYRFGLKGCTTFRPNRVTGSILETTAAGPDSHCCGVDRSDD